MGLIRTVTKAEASRFIDWICNEFNFQIKDIDTSNLRWARAVLLQGGIDLDDFNAITLFGNVYVRHFRDLKPYQQVRLLAHESRHIVMSESMGHPRFYAKYVSCRNQYKWRSRIEVDGHCGTIDFYRWQRPEVEPNWTYLDKALKSYKIPLKRRIAATKAWKKWDRKHSQTGKNNVAHFWKMAGNA